MLKRWICGAMVLILLVCGNTFHGIAAETDIDDYTFDYVEDVDKMIRSVRNCQTYFTTGMVVTDRFNNSSVSSVDLDSMTSGSQRFLRAFATGKFTQLIDLKTVQGMYFADLFMKRLSNSDHEKLLDLSLVKDTLTFLKLPSDDAKLVIDWLEENGLEKVTRMENGEQKVYVRWNSKLYSGGLEKLQAAEYDQKFVGKILKDTKTFVKYVDKTAKILDALIIYSAVPEDSIDPVAAELEATGYLPLQTAAFFLKCMKTLPGRLIFISLNVLGVDYMQDTLDKKGFEVIKKYGEKIGTKIFEKVGNVETAAASTMATGLSTGIAIGYAIGTTVNTTVFNIDGVDTAWQQIKWCSDAADVMYDCLKDRQQTFRGNPFEKKNRTVLRTAGFIYTELVADTYTAYGKVVKELDKAWLAQVRDWVKKDKKNEELLNDIDDMAALMRTYLDQILSEEAYNDYAALVPADIKRAYEMKADTGVVTPSYANGSVKQKSPDMPVVVSMGDSYAAGQGVPPFYGFTADTPAKVLFQNADWLAHRSTHAWSGQLKFNGGKQELSQYKDANWFFTAVSGATTEHIGATKDQISRKDDLKLSDISESWFEGTNQGMPYSRTDGKRKFVGTALMPKQIEVFDELAKRKLKADYVTLSIGGNDVGFVQDLEVAILESIAVKLHRTISPLSILTFIRENAAALHIVIGNTAKGFDFPIDDGKSDTDDRDNYNYKNKLKQVYINIADAAGPQARILVTGYPSLLDENIEKVTFPEIPGYDDLQYDLRNDEMEQVFIYACNGLGQILFAEGDARALNDASTYLNNKIEQAVSEMRSQGMNIYFVPISFKGHEAYTDDPWINPVVFLQMHDDVQEVPDNFVSGYSIHPNSKGVAEYARRVQEVIDILEEDALVTGTVHITDENGSPAGNEEIKLVFTDSSDNKYQTVTDYKGTYSIQLPRDEFTVQILRPDTGTAYDVDVPRAFGGESPSVWTINGQDSYIRCDENGRGLRMRINCYKECRQEFYVRALPEEALPVPAGPKVSSVDELMELYLQAIKESYEFGKLPGDLPAEKGISVMIGIDALNARRDSYDPYEALGYNYIYIGDEEVLLIGRADNDFGPVYDAYRIRDGVPELILQAANQTKFYMDLTHETVQYEWSSDPENFVMINYRWDDALRLKRMEADAPWEQCVPEEIYLIPFSHWEKSRPEPSPDGPNASSLNDLMELYIRTIRECYDDEIFYADLPEERGISMCVGSDVEYAKYEGLDPYEELGYCLYGTDDAQMLLIGNTNDMDGIVYDAYAIRNGTPKLILQSEERGTYYWDGLHATVRFEGSDGADDSVTEEYYLDDDYGLVRVTEDDPRLCNPEEIDYTPFSQWGSGSTSGSEQPVPDDAVLPAEYLPLIEEYTRLASLKEGYDDEIWESEFWFLYYLTGGGETREDVVGYCLKDMDGNGVPKLILGTVEGSVYGEQVKSVYSIEDGYPVNVVYPDEYGSYKFTQDGLVCTDIALPPDGSALMYSRLNGTELELVEGIVKNGDDAYLAYDWDDVYSEEYGSMTRLSSQEAEALQARHPLTAVGIRSIRSIRGTAPSGDGGTAESDSGPASLLPVLEYAAPDRIIRAFEQADYDGDGTYEAFGLALEYVDDIGSPAELWFVKGSRAIRCESGCCYYETASCIEEKDRKTLYRVIEGYGGSGELIRYWGCANGEPYLYHGEYGMVGRSVLDSEDWVETSIVVDETPNTTEETDDAQAVGSEASVTGLYIDPTVGEEDGASLALPGKLTFTWETDAPVEAYSLAVSDVSGSVLAQEENYTDTFATLDTQNLQLFETYRFAVWPASGAADASGREILFRIVDDAYLSGDDHIGTPTMSIEPSWVEDGLYMVHPGDVTLRWHADGPVDHYTLEISNGNAENDISQDFTAEETPLMIPEVDAPHDYLITVTAVPRDGQSESTSSSMNIRAVPDGYVDNGDASPDPSDRARQGLTDLGLLPEDASDEEMRETLIEFQKWVNSMLDQQVLPENGEADDMTLFYIDYCVNNDIQPDLPEASDDDEAYGGGKIYTEVPPQENEDRESSVDADPDPEAIRMVQEMLVKVGVLAESDMSGTYDTITAACVGAFQWWADSNGLAALKVTGTVDADTYKALGYCVDHGMTMR